MSVVTIRIPADQLHALRESLTNRKVELEREPPSEQVVDLAGLIEQMAPERDVGSPSVHEVSGSHALLWGAAYDVLCAAAECFAEDCAEYWREGVDPIRARTDVASLAARLEVLIALGPAADR
jgi:hypothetical protein